MFFEYFCYLYVLQYFSNVENYWHLGFVLMQLLGFSLFWDFLFLTHLHTLIATKGKSWCATSPTYNKYSLNIIIILEIVYFHHFVNFTKHI